MSDSPISFEFSQDLTSIQKSLYGYILSLLPNRSDAEDVLQETNLILCKKATEFDPKGHFQGWAFKIARYQVMSHLTKSKRSRLHFSNEIIDEEMGVKIVFLKDYDGIRYELVAPFGDNSPVTNVLKRKKDFLNHIAYETDDFEIEINRLRKAGLVPLGAPKKAKAFQGSRVIFFLSPLGFIVELIEVKID